MYHVSMLAMVVSLILGAGIATYIWQANRVYGFDFLGSVFGLTVCLNLAGSVVLVQVYLGINLFRYLVQSKYEALVYVFLLEIVLFMLFLMMGIFSVLFLDQFRGESAAGLLWRMRFVLCGMGAILVAVYGWFCLYSDTSPIRMVLSVSYGVGAAWIIGWTMTITRHLSGEELVRVRILRSMRWLLIFLFGTATVLMWLRMYGGMNFPTYAFSGYLLLANAITGLFFMKCLAPFLRRESALVESEERMADWFLEQGLTRREEEVARLLLQGKSNRDMEEILFISSRTIKFHTHNIYRKTGVNSRFQFLNLYRNPLK